MKKFLLVCVMGALLSSPAFASKAMLRVLRPLKGGYGMEVGSVKVRGSDARELLRDYAERIKGFAEYKIKMHMRLGEFPETDGSEEVIGLARVIDVVDYITDPTGDSGFDRDERKARQAEVRDLLFRVRDMGGLIGVDSHSWSTCGVTFPGVIILDVKAKEVISISPAETGC